MSRVTTDNTCFYCGSRDDLQWDGRDYKRCEHCRAGEPLSERRCECGRFDAESPQQHVHPCPKWAPKR